ncbi:MAG: 6-bladed beta-propeller [Alphaproteobacteria bacterium]|nr:6-bladed beta-propeller [Alphaproteobacteria bacterium]MBT7942681.1 6-bladed beta-propeller [Alphaproteobacteria bacterium]
MRILKKVLLVFVFALVGVVAIGWWAFVPSLQETPYVFISAWGQKGEGPGQFQDPTGIAVHDKEVYVSDARGGRVQVFDLDGKFRRQIGGLGRPMNLAISGGELFVAEYWNDRISVFDLDGTPKRIIGDPGSGPGQFKAPGGIAVAANGDLFVADFYNQRIQQLRADGTFIRQWGTTGSVGIGSGEFNYPTDVALGPDGSFYVADGYNDRIQAFAPAGGLAWKRGGPWATNIWGPFRGWFATVTAVSVGPDGNVFAADFYNNRVQKFSAEGAFLTAFGEKGDGPGRMAYITGVAVAADGSVFAADFGNNRITRWRPE